MIQEDHHAVLPVHLMERFRWVPYFSLMVNAQNSKSIMGAIISPVKDTQEADKISDTVLLTKEKTGNIKLTFEQREQQYHFNYRNGTKGLSLIE